MAANPRRGSLTKSALAVAFFVATLDAAAATHPRPSRADKLAFRERLAGSQGALSEPFNGDYAQYLVDELRYDRLADMDRAGLRKAAVTEPAWSGWYWPHYRGMLAERYDDPGFPHSEDWKENSDYVLENLGTGPSGSLSPAEKYDLLVGDAGFTLTRLMLNQGGAYYSAQGYVQQWMGICNGWSAAAMKMPRPLHSVTVIGTDGRAIRFNPADLKALASLMWNNGGFHQRFIGLRCESRYPSRNRTGRDFESACLDSNPGTWHLAITNQIGAADRPFIMDSSRDMEVWNQPVVGYSYRYYNPVTLALTDSLEAATVARRDFAAYDIRKIHRSPRATAFVGVSMNVDYVYETEPSAAKRDSPEQDNIVTATYVYDLELDASGRIIGGEWYSQDHPDFLWLPTRETTVSTAGDAYVVGAWDTDTQLPASWARTAAWTSRYLQPLKAIVEALFERSRDPLTRDVEADLQPAPGPQPILFRFPK